MRPPLLISFIVSKLLLTSIAALATPYCGELPDSELRFYIAEPTSPKEYTVSPAELDVIAKKFSASSVDRTAHPLMLMLGTLAVDIAVNHHTVAVQKNGSTAYCDAPTAVSVRVGTIDRRVFLLRDAAADSCVRRTLLQHYDEHSRALDDELRAFVENHRSDVASRLRGLKQVLHHERTAATKAFERGAGSLVVELFKRVESEIHRTKAQIDTPERLEALRNACDGKVRQIEQEIATPAAHAQMPTTQRRL